jgi:hypothetical protein
VFPDEDEDGQPTEVIERSVQGLVSYGVQGAVLATETGGFVLIYVRPEEDLEPHRAMAEALISSWERRDREEEKYLDN